MANIFKKEDIKAGYLLRVKDIKSGEEFNMTVVPTDAYTPSYSARAIYGAKARSAGQLAAVCPGKHWWGVEYFEGDLVETHGRRHQVVAVFGYTSPEHLLDNSMENRELLWEREKPEEKKLFPLEDIKAGYLLRVRDDDGSTYNMTVVPGRDGVLGCHCPQEEHYWPLSRFGEDLRYSDSAIMAVYGGTCNKLLLANTTEDRVQLWSRE